MVPGSSSVKEFLFVRKGLLPPLPCQLGSTMRAKMSKSVLMV